MNTIQNFEQKMIPIGQLIASGLNKRSEMNKAQLEGMANTIKSAGILQAITVRLSNKKKDCYEIIFGNRRWKAAGIAGLKEVPCVIRDISDDLAQELIMIENIQREDEHPMDMCDGFLDLFKIYPDVHILAAKTGKDASFITRVMHLNKLIDSAKKAFREDSFSLDHALEIARLPTAQAQKEILQEQIERGFTLRELHREIERSYYLLLSKATFDTEDAALLPAAGKCSTCPKRTGSNELLFPDIKEHDTCTDPKCYDAKVKALIAKEKKQWGHETPLIQLSALPSWQPVPKDVLPSNQYSISKSTTGAGVRHGIIVLGENAGKIVAFTDPKALERHSSPEQWGRRASRFSRR